MDFFIYLAKASLVLTLFWVVYKLFLEVETYHRFKRIYLLAGYGLSLMLPLFTFTRIEEITLASTGFVPSSSGFLPVEITKSPMELFWAFVTEHSILELMYLAISLVFVIHLGLKLFKLLRFLKNSKVLKGNGSFFIEKPIPEGAFSFLNYIVYNPDLYTEDELKIILAHEQAHVHKRHSLDILLAHVYKCFFWFNPFAWLYQKSLVLNLEYEADAKVVDTTAKRDYQMTLYSITQQQYKHQLQHSFNQSPIKKRIAMLNKNKHNSSFWKLFIVSPLLVTFFLLFQIETKAQIKEAETTPEAKITRVEITYDENTTREELNSDREFLKQEFNIDVSYSMLKFTSDRKLKSITLDVDCNDGFKGSVTSPNVEKLPVYFYRDYSEGVEKPFGVGTVRDDEQTALTEPEDFKDVETFIINKQKFDKSELLNKYIPVKQYTFMEDQNTLYITTRSEFSKSYYDGMFEAKDELNALFEKGEKPEGVVYYKVEDDDVIVMTINNFKISESAENASQYHTSTPNFINKYPNQNIIFILDDQEIEERQMSSIKPDEIKSVTVIKDSKQLKAEGYDSEEVDGLIKIVSLKEGETALNPDKALENYKSELESSNKKIIYLVDGEVMSQEEIDQLDPKQIKTMFVVKGAVNLKKKGYDPEKVSGVIQITTKN